MVKIKFNYSRIPVQIAAIPFDVNRDITLCTVETDEYEAVGRAIKNPFDDHDKYAARKLALTRAIEHLPRPQRREVWSAYLEKHKV